MQKKLEMNSRTKNDIGRQVKLVKYVHSDITQRCIHNALIERKEILRDLEGAGVDEVKASDEHGGFTTEVLLKVHASLPGKTIHYY